jgi:hypothetical protein
VSVSLYTRSDQQVNPVPFMPTVPFHRKKTLNGHNTRQSQVFHLSDGSQRAASRLIKSMFRIVISSTMASSRLLFLGYTWAQATRFWPPSSTSQMKPDL